MTHAVDLIAEAVAIDVLNANVIEGDMGAHAIGYVVNGWEVGPLCERDPDNPHIVKGPFGKTPHPRLTPRGVLDFTNVAGMAAVWWGSGTPWNIGIRPPASMFVLDIDPRSGGLNTLRKWANTFADPLTPLAAPTLTTISGRWDGGRHLYFQHPGGKLSAKRLKGTGVDLKTHAGYVVAAPSIHPDTGRPYIRIDHPVAVPPRWLVDLLRPPAPPRSSRPRSAFAPGFWSPPSIADQYSSSTSWAQILEPHDWRCLDADPDADGARWLHPNATSACSATVKHTCLFVYSTSTEFDVTEAGDPNGYTKFAAYALLNHGGDMSAAARALRGRR